MSYCCVPMCKERGGYRFPKDSSTRAKWVVAVKRQNLIVTDLPSFAEPTSNLTISVATLIT
jgi:hypothetical protein